MIGLLLALFFHKWDKRRNHNNQETNKKSEDMINLADIKDSKEKFDNRYRLINKIGGGGFSEVWIAYDTNADIDVALKIYTPNSELDEEGKEDFKREFARLCGLNHSNIIHAIGFGIHNEELPYLAMSVCKDGSAKKLIGNYEEEQLWTFIEQVALGLQYLHAHSITHQDIKPDNILINSDGQYLIIDFGISTKTRNTLRKSAKGTMGGGTPWYMSVESFGSESSDIHARDIWAFGATLYEIITGDVPFGQYGGVTQKSQNGKIPPIINDVSEELKQLVYDCLALDAWDRPDADALVKRAKDHIAGIAPPSSSDYKKVMMVLSALVLFAVCYFTYPYIFSNNNKDNHVVVVNKNDSIFLSKTAEFSNIMAKESELIRGQKEVDKISLDRVIYALDQCKDIIALSDSVSNDAREKGNQKINTTISEAKIVCDYLERRGDDKINEYGEYGVEARDRYYSLSDAIKTHMNTINLNK